MGFCPSLTLYIHHWHRYLCHPCLHWDFYPPAKYCPTDHTAIPKMLLTGKWRQHRSSKMLLSLHGQSCRQDSSAARPYSMEPPKCHHLQMCPRHKGQTSESDRNLASSSALPRANWTWKNKGESELSEKPPKKETALRSCKWKVREKERRRCFERGPENLVATWSPSSARNILTDWRDSTYRRSSRMR